MGAALERTTEPREIINNQDMTLLDTWNPRDNSTSMDVHNNQWLMFLFQVDSEEEKFLEERYAEKMAKSLPQGTDKTPGLLQNLVAGLPDR